MVNQRQNNRTQICLLSDMYSLILLMSSCRPFTYTLPIFCFFLFSTFRTTMTTSQCKTSTKKDRIILL